MKHTKSVEKILPMSAVLACYLFLVYHKKDFGRIYSFIYQFCFILCSGIPKTAGSNYFCDIPVSVETTDLKSEPPMCHNAYFLNNIQASAGKRSEGKPYID